MSLVRLKRRGFVVPGSDYYDTSVGAGVSGGLANLPLRSGAKRIFVNPLQAGASDSNSGLDPSSAPLQTILAGRNKITNNAGDQLLVAEGTTFTEGLPNCTGGSTGLNNCSGYSPLFPTVYQTYDPADPFNEAKYGRATSGRPVINRGSNPQVMTSASNSPTDYIAIRGFDISPDNLDGLFLGFFGSASKANDYVLLENNIVRFTQLTMTTGCSRHIIVRRNSLYGAWNDSAHAQSIYMSGASEVTVEDNFWWHGGWNTAGDRDQGDAAGGPTIYNQGFYYQDDCRSARIRRNLIVDAAAAGGSLRSNQVTTHNVFIDNPIALFGGKGDNYNVIQPAGVDVEIAYNAILGDADITSVIKRGGGIIVGNTRLGSSVHHNLIARSRDPFGTNVQAFGLESEFDQPSYCYFHDNVEYQWAQPGKVYKSDGAFLSQNFPTFDRNAWSDPASGTNINIADHVAPNPLTLAQLCTAFGFADKNAWMTYALNHPEDTKCQEALALLQAGYGIAA